MLSGVRVVDGSSNKLICLNCGFTAEILKDSKSFGKLDLGLWVCPICHKSNKGLV